jgi:hypothetical protein
VIGTSKLEIFNVEMKLKEIGLLLIGLYYYYFINLGKGER